MTYYQSQHRYGFPLSRYAGPGNVVGWDEPKEPRRRVRKTREPPKRTHPDHPDCPNSLNCLPDTDEKPNHILPVIVRSAILGSPKKRLTLREIYSAVEDKFSYFRNTSTGWKDSIRHNLSLNRLFMKVPRPSTEPGLGAYWAVDLKAPPGSKRPRKRGIPNHVSFESSPHPPSTSAGSSSMILEAPYQFDSEDPNPKETRSSHSGSEFEDEDEDEEQAEDPQSEYESEDEGDGPRPDRRGSFNPPPILTHLNPDETPEDAVARLNTELIESQQQFSVASAFALRVSTQLEDAKDLACKAQIKLREAEQQLEEELVARVQVEKKLEEEEKLRKEAEEQLKTLVKQGGLDVKLFEAVRSIQDISQRVLGR